MNSIYCIVKRSLRSGCLTAEAEDQIRQLFDRGCNLDDLEALSVLQDAVTSGHVKRVSQDRETEDEPDHRAAGSW